MRCDLCSIKGGGKSLTILVFFTINMISFCLLTGCEVYLVLIDTLVPEPLIEDFIFKSSGASHNTLLDVSNGGGILHNFNHTYNTAAKTEGNK